MTNNYSGLAFWRAWHRSFYLWIVKYLYVPMGGRKFAMWSIWPIFTFVAIWHDLQLKLLAWGWLICVFAAPELIARRWFKPVLEKRLTPRLYRQVAAFAAALSIQMMMYANLVGFVIGIDGLHAFLAAYTSVRAMPFLIAMMLTSIACAHVQLELRREEERRGIKVAY